MTDLEMVKLAAKAAELDAESAAAPFGDEAEAEKAERGIAPLLNVLRLEARYAEWRDKEIHPVNGPAFQAWILEIQLPVPLDEPDKSPEAALNRWLASVGVQ